MAEARCQTIRLKPLKIGALVGETIRMVEEKFSSGCRYADMSRWVHTYMARSGPWIPKC